MTQLKLLNPVYLIDSSSIVGLDGKHRIPPSPPEYTPAERIKIWDGLEHFAKIGRVKLIKQVIEELKLWNPQGLARLAQYPGYRLIIRRTSAIVLDYQYVTKTYHDIVPRPGRDMADPWLIVATRRHGCPIVCEELSLSQRTSTETDLRIPDICQLEGAPKPLRLRELAYHEGWLP